MAVLLTGKPVADALSADTRTRAEALLSKGVQPRLVLLRCGDNEADGAYIRGAVKRAALCGVAAELRTLPADASADVVAAAIDAASAAPSAWGGERPLRPPGAGQGRGRHDARERCRRVHRTGERFRPLHRPGLHGAAAPLRH